MIITFLRSIYRSFVLKVVDVPPRLLSFMFLLLLLAFPVTSPKPYVLGIMIVASTYAIFAASWDLLVGRTGQMSFGHALFFGVGAYTSALLYRYFQSPPWLTIPMAMLVGVLVAVLVGFPALRVKGPYLVLVTMALPLIMTGVIMYFRDITGGDAGIPLPALFPYRGLWVRYLEYYFTLIVLLVSGIILYKIAYSKTGIIFVSLLDDELASKACGINTTKYKLMAFAISALFASLAGSLNAYFISSANTGALALTLSFTPVMTTILGGIGTIYGPIAATYILQVLDRYILRVPPFRIDEVWHPIIFIGFIIILVIKWPRGIARFATDKLGDLSEEREIEERGPRLWKKYRRKKEHTPEG